MTTPAETREKLQGADPGSPAGDSPETKPNLEVQDPSDKPKGDAETPKAVSLEAHQELLRRLDAQNAQIKELQTVAGFINKAKQLFAPQGDQPELSDRDKLVRSEMLRIMPELAHLRDVNQIKQVLTETGAARVEQVAANAWKVQQRLQGEYEIAVGDAEASESIGYAIQGWINKDPARARRFHAGDETVLEEGFKAVVGKLYGPARLAKKRQILATREKLPTGGPARGASPGAGGKGVSQINFQDRRSVRSALAASFAAGAEE